MAPSTACKKELLPPDPENGAMVSELRRWGREVIEPLAERRPPSQISKDTLALEVDLLLAWALGKDRTALIAHRDEIPGDVQQSLFCSAVRRRATGEPTAYIIGRKDFYNFSLSVTPDVLIPRPETELIVDHALLMFQPEPKGFFLIDVGTGSGAIVLAVLDELRARFGEAFLERGRAAACDISPAALEVARDNARRFGLDAHIDFLCCDLLDGLAGSIEAAAAEPDNLTVIVSNPPYVSDAELLPEDVDKFEPRTALRAGEKGLDIIHQLLEQAAPSIQSGALLLLEVGDRQSDAVESRVKLLGLPEPRFYRDLAGKKRVVEIGETRRAENNA